LRRKNIPKSLYRSTGGNTVKISQFGDQLKHPKALVVRTHMSPGRLVQYFPLWNGIRILEYVSFSNVIYAKLINYPTFVELLDFILL
jgi:hypothetical protein